MKSEQFKYNAQTSNIRGHQEEPESDTRNWDRVAYLVLLGFFAAALIYYLVTSFYLVEGKGRVLVSQLTVRAPADIQLTGMPARPGQTLREGDSLFTYRYAAGNPADSIAARREERRALRGDRLEIRAAIEGYRQELQSLQQKLDYYIRRRDLIEKEIRLGVETVNRLQSVETEILDLKADLAKVRSELQAAGRRLALLKERADAVAAPDSGAAARRRGMLYRSPAAGTVTTLFRESLETVSKSEKIISIQRDSAQVLAKVLFDRDETAELPIGTVLDIRFDHGEPSRGVISDIYAAEADMQPVFNLSGIDASDKVVVELKPLNPQVRQQWLSLNGMGLTASKTLF